MAGGEVFAWVTSPGQRLNLSLLFFYRGRKASGGGVCGPSRPGG